MWIGKMRAYATWAIWMARLTVSGQSVEGMTQNKLKLCWDIDAYGEE